MLLSLIRQVFCFFHLTELSLPPSALVTMLTSLQLLQLLIQKVYVCGVCVCVYVLVCVRVFLGGGQVEIEFELQIIEMRLIKNNSMSKASSKIVAAKTGVKEDQNDFQEKSPGK